jgi:2-amino-4-hydroxy-6-hydroxymethyldihydropteridine diphosphokinase
MASWTITAIHIPAAMPRSHISLGGNLGAVADTFASSLDRLNRVPGNNVIAVSRFHETTSVGDNAGGAFMNAAAEVETQLGPLELLDLLQDIEGELGRTREIRWGPRTLDMDVIFYGSELIDLPRLIVPHPAAWYRRFVLDPLVEIAADFVHPERQVTVKMLRERLLRRPLVAALIGGEAKARSDLILDLADAFPDVNLQDCTSVPQTNDQKGEPALIFWLGQHVDRAKLSGSFAQLPILSRIDATATSEPVEDFVRQVLQSALG